MEAITSGLNPAVNLKISAEQTDKLELIDNLEISAVFKSQNLIPYLTSLWESLSARSLNPQEGLPKFAFTEVKFSVDVLVCQLAWNHWGKSLLSDKF